jgi:hypothetical protein
MIGFFIEATSLDLCAMTIGLLKTDPLKTSLPFIQLNSPSSQVELGARNLVLAEEAPLWLIYD